MIGPTEVGVLILAVPLSIYGLVRVAIREVHPATDRTPDERPDYRRIASMEHEMGMHAPPNPECRACAVEWSPARVGEPDPFGRMGIVVAMSGKQATMMSMACPDCHSRVFHAPHLPKPGPPQRDPGRRSWV
jgi:hypothetical protein